LSRTRGGISHPPGGAVVGVENYAVSIYEVSLSSESTKNPLRTDRSCS